MKKILLLAAALLAFAGCKEKEVQPDPEPQADEISVAPAERTIGGEGGEVSVTVTSSSDWTLASKDNAKYDWVTSGKTYGKTGDKVVFTVDPNTEKEKVAEFVFSCGKAEASFKLTSTPQEVIIPTIEVTSANPVEVAAEEGTFQVTLNVSETVEVSDLEAVAKDSWVVFVSAEEGEEPGTAVMNFSYQANEATEARETEVTISYPNADPASVTVKQAAAETPEEPEIELTSPMAVEVEAAAGTVEMTFKISSNVNFLDFNGSADQNWIRFASSSQNVPGTAAVAFEYDANTTAESRRAIVRVNYGDMNCATVMVTQKAGEEVPVGGDYVAYMKDHCASPEYTVVGDYSFGQITWNRPEVLNFGKTITVEMLVKHDEEFEEKTGYPQWDGSWVNTILGIEGCFLIRQGDNTSNYPQWELVYCYSNPETNATSEAKYQSNTGLPGGAWAHLAVVVDGTAQKVTLYQNGEEVASGALNENALDIDLSQILPGWKQQQAFSFGRSSDNARDFCGAMAEVRLWNRALSQAEIKAEGHFYSVDPASDGLVAYWKMNEGSGTVFQDYTANGNDLTAYKIIDNSTSTGKYGLGNWEVKFDGWQQELPEVAGFPRQ